MQAPDGTPAHAPFSPAAACPCPPLLLAPPLCAAGWRPGQRPYAAPRVMPRYYQDPRQLARHAAPSPSGPPARNAAEVRPRELVCMTGVHAPRVSARPAHTSNERLGPRARARAQASADVRALHRHC